MWIQRMPSLVTMDGSAWGSSGSDSDGPAAAHRAHGQTGRADDGHVRPLPGDRGRRSPRFGRGSGHSRRHPPETIGKAGVWRVYTGSRTGPPPLRQPAAEAIGAIVSGPGGQPFGPMNSSRMATLRRWAMERS